MKYGKQLKKFCAISAALMTLTNCSGVQAVFGIEDASEAKEETYRQLLGTLPTASTKDTVQTKIEVGTHRAVFFALCPSSVCTGPQ